MRTYPSNETIARVRRFTRFYTRKIGVLQEALLGSDFNLPEGRVIYEIAHRERTTASDLVASLDLDAGYLSRLLKGLERRDFLARSPSLSDGRQNLLTLTNKGRKKFEEINKQSDIEVGRLIEPLNAGERRALRLALTTIERLLDGSADKPACIFRDFRPGDMGWIVHRHGALYAEEYGWDSTFEALVANVAGEFVRKFDPRWDKVWIAEMDGRIVGSILLVKKTKAIAKLRLLYVDAEARGLGIGRRLVDACIEHARKLGYQRMTLWTNDVLTAARAIYVAAGFELMHSESHHSFGKDLVGETWERDL